MPGSQFAVISGLQINRLKLSFWKPGALENNRPIPALQRKQIDMGAALLRRRSSTDDTQGGLDCGDLPGSIANRVNAVVFSHQVIAPVGLEVAA